MEKQVEGIKKRRHTKPGTRALREIRQYQKSDKRIIPRLIMKRLIREQLDGRKLREGALNALHECVEDFATTLFRGVQAMAIHAKRKTIQVEDMRTLKRVFLLMTGHTDLDPEPINPRMSAAHRKQCASRQRTKRVRNKPTAVPLPDAGLMLVESEEVVQEEQRPLEEENGDDWLI